MAVEAVDMNYIEFGNGGGFAGSLTKFKLFENGRMMKQGSYNSKYLSHTVVDEELCKQLFNTVKTLSLQEKQIQDPGNLYYFITIKDSDMMMNFKWGGMNETVDPSVKTFHKLLSNIANTKHDAVE